MQKKNGIAAFVIGFAVAAAGFGWMTFRPKDSPDPAVSELQRVVASQREELLGYTKYTDYLSASKQKLQEQMKFIAATVRREEGYTRQVNRKIVSVNFNSVVAISYTAEYSFGYELKPGDYEIASTATGINVTIRKPILVALPATSSPRHKILSGSVFTDSQAAVIGLYEGLSTRTLASGRALATDEAVVALCEKKLLTFLRDFLAKQPGVKHIPNITISYK